MYRIKLEGRLIGETQLETADPPMGVVGGKVNFLIPDSLYYFFKSYCNSHQIIINQDEEEFECIDTQNIQELKVYRSDGVEIAGVPGASISGFQDEGYYITILGVPYPFYEEEFSHHCESYKKQFQDYTG